MNSSRSNEQEDKHANVPPVNGNSESNVIIHYSISITDYQPDQVSLLIKKVTNRDGQTTTDYSSANYLFKAGIWHLLTLNDLFDPKSDYRKAICSLIEGKLDFENLIHHADNTRVIVTPEMLEVFTLSQLNITFTFSDTDAKTLSKHAISLSYMLFQEYLNPNGPLAKFLSVDGKDPVTGLTAEEAVKMGAVSFSNRYYERTKDDSDAGMRQSALVYCALVSARNDALIAKLPTVRQQQCRKARELLYRLADVEYDAQYADAGGGTLWEIQCDDFHGDAEATLARMIPSLRNPSVNSPTVHARLVKNLRAIDANYAKLL